MEPPQRSPEYRLVNEFASYYNADELPPADSLAAQLPHRAAESADRLRHVLGDAAPALAPRLRALADDPDDPLFESIANATMIDWHNDGESWPIMQQLMRGIADDLEGAGDA